MQGGSILVQDKSVRIEQLLHRTSAAHGEYETKVLDGVYDQEWYIWYAQWAVEHGLNELVAQPMNVQQWSQILYDLNEQHKQTDRHQSWAEFTAAQLVIKFG
jgi:hypothetical protein